MIQGEGAGTAEIVIACHGWFVWLLGVFAESLCINGIKRC
jgi:hypothetical protein